MNYIDHTGARYGKLVAQHIDSRKNGRVMWSCLCDCGKTKLVRSTHLKAGKVKSCGCLQGQWAKDHPMDQAPNWKGGRVIDDWGYILIRQPNHHRAKSNGYVREHIVNMETKLGRPLFDGETVHHINGIKDDNKPENLELWASHQPPGQRVEDLVKWAKDILSRYS